MVPLPLAATFVLAALAASLAGAPVEATMSCPGSPLRLVQDDARSGRDAGDAPSAAVPVEAEGWSFGSLTLPVNDTVEDISDWFTFTVPEGARRLTFDGQNVANLVVGMGNTVPLILYYEVWRTGEASPALEFASWAQPQPFESPGAEELRFHVYPSPLFIIEGCTSLAPAPATLGVMVDAAQTYGILADCDPDCFPA